MAFTPRLSAEGISGNPWWYSSGNVFYASGYGMPNCTCYAYGRFAEIRNAFAALPTGDAGSWYDAVVGFNKGRWPRLGAVACYASESGKYAGHVAIVEVINEDGSIVTSNSAYRGTYFWTETVTPADGYCSDWMKRNRDYYCQGFIYNDAVGGIGASAHVVAAICGNWKRESTVNPGIWESLEPTSFDHQYAYDNIGGYGLGQWTNVGTPYGRLWNLHEWVNANGFTDGDGDGQLAYMLQENYWLNSSYTHGTYTTLEEFLTSDSTNMTDLVWDFLANWEGNPGDALAERLEAANLFLQVIEERKNDNPNNYHWISSNEYLDWADMYNNVMCVYFWLSSGAPAPTPEQRKGLPLWMLLRYLP